MFYTTVQEVLTILFTLLLLLPVLLVLHIVLLSEFDVDTVFIVVGGVERLLLLLFVNNWLLNKKLSSCFKFVFVFVLVFRFIALAVVLHKSIFLKWDQFQKIIQNQSEKNTKIKQQYSLSCVNEWSVQNVWFVFFLRTKLSKYLKIKFIYFLSILTQANY